LQRAKAKVGGAWECKSPAKSPGASRDINKTGRYTPYKKMIKLEALARSIQTLQKEELGNLSSETGPKNARGRQAQREDEAMPNLVGAQDEPHQEQ
jgi:hypothetical protein